LVDNSDINLIYSLVQELYSHNVEVKLICTDHYLASSQIRTDIFPTLLKCTILYYRSNNA